MHQALILGRCARNEDLAVDDRHWAFLFAAAARANIGLSDE
jgi:hypothetical protein